MTTREAFEEWYEVDCYPCEHSNWFRLDSDGDYEFDEVQYAWRTWQAATETVITEYRQQCLDNAAEIARLRKLIADHVNSSNNDDSAGDTFGALMAEVQPKHKPKPFIGTRSAIYKCTDCGHEQSVQEIHTEYGVYVGSGANWCDKCGDGKPERKETP